MMGAVRLRHIAAPGPTDAELEASLRFVAMAVELYGAVYMPIFDAIEGAIMERRRREDPAARVRRVLALHTVEGTAKAIR